MRRWWAAGMAMVLAGLAGAALWFQRGPSTTVRAPITDSTVVLLGDSLTEGGGWGELLPGRNVSNHGYSGFTSEELVPVADEIAEATPGMVVILAGTNDIRDGHPPSWTLAHLDTMIGRFRAASPATRIVVQTLLPRADAPGEVAAVNEALMIEAAEWDVTLIDLHPAFDDGRGGLRAGETSDGIHLSAAGYERWAGILERFLAAELGPVDADS